MRFCPHGHFGRINMSVDSFDVGTDTPSHFPSDASSNSTLDDGIDEVNKYLTNGTNVNDGEDYQPELHSDLASHANESTSGDVSDRVALVCDYLKTETLYMPLHATRELVAWKAENCGHRLVVKESDDTAVLTIIAIISTDNFFLTPDAYYKGGTNVTPSLANVKLTCVARRPLDPGVADDFALALTKVVWLMEQVRATGVPHLGVTQPTGSPNPVAFKF